MNNEEFPEDSDTSDEDYIPGNKPEEVVSEVDSDGDPEDPLSETEDIGTRNQKRKKKTGNKRRKKTKTTDKNEDESTTDNKQEKTEEEKKKSEDSLWADFMKDTGFKSKAKVGSVNGESVKAAGKTEGDSKDFKKKREEEEKVKVKQVFNFAGEDVVVEKEVPVHSVQARLLQKSSSSSEAPKSVKGRGLGGIGSVLKQIGKKPKISTLEKTKLDWDRYKKEENIEEELAKHNKGKDGYLERQDFLERTDVRRFEIERSIREIERNKRLDNANPL